MRVDRYALTAAVAILIGGSGAVSAQTRPELRAEWISRGPYGGQVDALVVDWQNPNVVYAATSSNSAPAAGSIFKSVDEGETWKLLRLPGGGGGVGPLLIDPRDSNTLYAGSFRSEDAGDTWVNLGLPAGAAYVLDVDARGALYTKLDGAGALFTSSDGGATWTKLGGSGAVPIIVNYNPQSLAINPQDPAVLYVAGAIPSLQLQGVFRSADGGANWAPLNFPGNTAEALIVDPRKPDTLYALTGNGRGILKSSDAGATWMSVNTGLAIAGSAASGRGDADFLVSSLAIDPDDSSTLYATAAPFSQTAPGNDAVFRSTDGGGNWVNLASPFAGALALAIGGRNPGTLYAGTNAGGVYKTTDGAASWRPVNSGLTAVPVTLLAVDPRDSNNVFAAGTPFGIFKSADGGQSWNTANSGLMFNGSGMPLSIYSLAIERQAPATLYALSDNSGFYRTVDGAGSWSGNCISTTGCPSLFSLALDPGNPDVLYGSGRWTPRIFQSSDAGLSWEASDPEWGFFLSTLVVDPADTGTLYARTDWVDCDWAICPQDYYDPTASYAQAGLGLFKSTDRGASWVKLVLPAGYLIVPAVSVDPQTSGTLYVLDLKSVDGGLTWAKLSLPAGVSSVAAVDSHGTLYGLAPAGGLFESTDGGANWRTLVIPGQYSIGVIAIDPQDPARIYAGSSNGVLSLRRAADR